MVNYSHSQQPTLRKSSTWTPLLNAIPSKHLIVLLVASVGSFYAGTLWSLHAGINDCSQSNGIFQNKNLMLQNKINGLQKSINSQKLDCSKSNGKLQSEINDLKETILDLQKHALTKKDTKENEKQIQHVEPYFPETVSKYAAGASRVSKVELLDHIDIGVPVSLPQKGDSEAIIIYNQPEAFPTNRSGMSLNSLNYLNTDDAIENCDFLNVILTTQDHARKQCIAIVPQYEAFHIYRLARVASYQRAARKLHSEEKLRLVSRAYNPKGKENFLPPSKNYTITYWETLKRFMDSKEQVMDELRPILSKIAVRNTVIVMVCNFGQSELLMNFVCSTKSRGFDISMIVVFATDEETKDLAESLGVTVYYDTRNFGVMPKHEAQYYGDDFFVQMMLAKSICVTFVSMLGYDFLFHDVDIVWYKHPIDWLHNEYKKFNEFDMIFQDDGGHTQRYAPLSANSGFYYVKANDRTRYLILNVMLSGDLIFQTDSHQQVLIARMNEHASLLALKVKIINRNDDELPGGYQYHKKGGDYLHAFFKGEKNPVIFHMSWTSNKDNKLLFLKQMGEWFVNDQCIQKSAKEIIKESPVNPLGRKNAGTQLEGFCCAAEPIFSCHYRDKPSIKPCKDSPPIDEGKPSWWT